MCNCFPRMLNAFGLLSVRIRLPTNVIVEKIRPFLWDTSFASLSNLKDVILCSAVTRSNKEWNNVARWQHLRHEFDDELDDEMSVKSSNGIASSGDAGRVLEAPTIVTVTAANELDQAFSPRALQAISTCVDRFAREHSIVADNRLDFTLKKLRKCGLTSIGALLQAPAEQWPKNKQGQSILPKSLCVMFQRETDVCVCMPKKKKLIHHLPFQGVFVVDVPHE